MVESSFKEAILQGIPNELPESQVYNPEENHAPKRKPILNSSEKELALHNALRYFKPEFHETLAKEFADELETRGRIYMYRFKPNYKMYARPISEYPCKSTQAAAIMHMITNNLDKNIAQHPDELVVYGGNGTAFQNWAQYLLTMKYLATMTDEQTLVSYSGHPLGLFPSHKDAPRWVIANGMVIPNYSNEDDYHRLNSLGVTQYGQMTAGSAMYIGPQGIVHGTTITLLNANRLKKNETMEGRLFVTSGLGGMSGAQAKAATITGAVGIIAEINPKALEKRFAQGWLNEKYDNLDLLIKRIEKARANKEAVSLGYLGNIVDLWERLAKENINVDLGSDQTSLHNPYAGGYYPVGLSFEESNKLMTENPEKFKELVHESLRRQVNAINKLSERGMYFWDYGNAFLIKARDAKANILKENGDFRYPSYVQDIMGPLCFDYGFGPFRWVCTSADPKDLEITDNIAASVLEEMAKTSPKEISQQIQDNLKWIREAGKNKLVVGSQARILYADYVGRKTIAKRFNEAIREGKIKCPIVFGRDHHDVSGTDSPFRETSNIYDGSNLTADMAIQNVIGDSFRGATWVSIHNGGGVGWGKVINGGFGFVLDGTKESEEKFEQMVQWDVNNGVARRSWAGNSGAQFAIKRTMETDKDMQVTMPYDADSKIIKRALDKSSR